MRTTGERKTISRVAVFKRIDEAERIVYAEVYVPYTGEGVPPLDHPARDAHGHWMRPKEVRKMAHRFLEELRVYHVDKQHDQQPDEGVVVESFIAREGDPDFAPGAWVVATKILREETWQQILKGEITGYSIQAVVELVPDTPQEAGGDKE